LRPYTLPCLSFFPGELKHEIHGKTRTITFDLFVQAFCFNAEKFSQISVEDYFCPRMKYIFFSMTSVGTSDFISAGMPLLFNTMLVKTAWQQDWYSRIQSERYLGRH